MRLLVCDGRTVNLHAIASNPDSGLLSYAWSQAAGKNVSLIGAATADASFVAPALGSKTESLLTLQVQVDDIKGGTASDSVNVLDLQRIGASWNKSLGHAGYDVACDFDGDSKVNVFDLQAMGGKWGKTLP